MSARRRNVSYADRLLGADAPVTAASEVRDRAHAPYSGYAVGAALRAPDGSIHVGANVENAAYPQGRRRRRSARSSPPGTGGRWRRR